MKQETLINVQQMNMSIIKEPDAEPINLRTIIVCRLFALELLRRFVKEK